MLTGTATLHAGQHLHAAQKLFQGERINLVVWFWCPSKFFYWSKLPQELQMSVLQFLSPSDLCAVQRCNKQLRRVAAEDKLWAPLYKTAFGEEFVLADEKGKHLPLEPITKKQRCVPQQFIKQVFGLEM